MTDLAPRGRSSQLAYRTPLKDGKTVGKCAPKASKPPSWMVQTAKRKDAKNCGLRFAGCEFAYFADLLPASTELSRQARSPVSIGLQDCLPTLPTYLPIKGWREVDSLVDVGRLPAVRVHSNFHGELVGKVGNPTLRPLHRTGKTAEPAKNCRLENAQ